MVSCAKVVGFSFPGEAREVASLIALLSGYPLSDFAAGALDYLARVLSLDSLHSGFTMAAKDAIYLVILAASGYFQWFILVPKLFGLLNRLFNPRKSHG